MSSSLANTSLRRFICTSPVVYRYATTNPEGRWIKNKPNKDSWLDWMSSTRAGKEPIRNAFYTIKDHDHIVSDSGKAKMNAVTKMEKFRKIAENRGHSRELKPYTPSHDVEDQIRLIAQELLDIDDKDEDWIDQPINDMFIKFKFLNECAKKLDYEVPSPVLHEMKTIRDVMIFYMTPVRGVTKLEELAQKQSELPGNLCVQQNYRLIDPTQDEFFKGLDAYPKTPLIVWGARAKKKYPNFKENFEWPDV